MLNRQQIQYPYSCDISIEEYHNLPGLSSTSMKVLLDCPYKYYDAYIAKNQVKKHTRAMNLGSLIHTYLLEKDSFDERYFVAQKMDKRLKAWKEIETQAGYREIIDEKDFDVCSIVEKRIKEHEYAAFLLDNGCAEKSYFWEDPSTGILLKARPDYITENYIVDVKTSVSCAKEDFKRSLVRYQYHMQAALQLDAYKAVSGISHTNYIYLVIETQEPYLISVFTLSDESINLGRQEYQKAIQLYCECINSNKWPTYVDGIEEICLEI
jgi:PDDEXK-like domain of unknown function (DUF3799)